MVQIEIRISSNGSDEERKDLYIPNEAIREFLGEGFVENKYDGRFILACLPRAFDPDLMEIIIDLKEITELLLNSSIIIGAILNFCKKCKGYNQNLIINVKNDETFISIPINEKSNIEKILKEINKITKKK